MSWFRPLLYVWVAPATLIGLCLVPMALLQGGRVRIVDGVIEAHGGVLSRVLRLHWPWIGSIGAITFGHVVLGYDEAILDISRDHERVHVRQYERWGPLFLPLYVLVSAILAVRGLDAYRDNPFEREAYGQSREEA